MSVRRMLPFILINVLVSAAVVLGILYWWDSRQDGQNALVTPTSVAFVAPTAASVVSSAPQSTPTPEAEDNSPLTHVVRAGDTLGSLSQFYEVSMVDIMTANNISDPNVLSVGEQLIIPIGGIATATPISASVADTATRVPPTPIPTAEPANSGEAVVEIAAVTGIDSLAEEAVHITNSGSRQIALLGWKLADASGHVYTFGSVTLFGDGAAIQLHTETGQDGPVNLYWGLETPIWNSGERVTLLDSEGTIKATFDIP